MPWLINYNTVRVQMTSGAHLNESLINGMFNQSRVSDASLSMSEESRVEPRALGSLRSISPHLQNYSHGHNQNHNHHNSKTNTNANANANTHSMLPSSLNAHHNPLNNSIFLLAKSQLEKFNECVGGIVKKTSQIEECFHKIQTIKKKNINTKILQKKATQNIDVLKQEIMISRTSTSNKLKLQFQNLKMEFKRNQMELKKLQCENQKMKSMKDGLLSKELKFQTEKKKMEGQQEKLEIQSVMENMLVEVEKGLDLERVMNENKLLTTKIQTLDQEVRKSKQQQDNLLDKTRLLQQKLKISQSSQLRSRSQSITMSFQSELQLSPTQTQISDLLNSFTFYIQNIEVKLLNNASFHKTHLKNSNNDYFRQLQHNSSVFAKIIEWVKKIDIGRHSNSGVMVDISNFSNGDQKTRAQSSLKSHGNRGKAYSNGHSNVSSNVLVYKNGNHKDKIIKEILVNSMPREQSKSTNIMKEYKILKIQNRNLKEVNKALKGQFMTKLEETAAVVSVSSNFTHSTPSSTPPTSTPPTLQATDIQERCRQIQKKYKKARIDYQQLFSQHSEVLLREKKIQFELMKERGDKRKLHNEIQDMRGSIRIYCRLCPHKPEKNPLQYKINSSADTIILQNKGREFKFDAVYGENSSQQEIFQDTKRLIHSSVDGYNACILACGQTGSGKTYTLIGDQESPGMSIRSIEQIFCVKKERKEYLKIEVNMSILEIYLDSIRDLLSDRRELKSIIPQSILNTLNLSPNYTFYKVTTADQGIIQYKKRIKERQTSSTLFPNSRSRSPLILTLVIEAQNILTNQKRFSKFTVIDLSGSQSFSKLNFKTQQQQSSISLLKTVVTGLNSKDSVSKYRQNKLSPFLKESLSGNTKTLIFVNISSEDSSQQETLTSLQFAQGLKKIDRSNIIIKRNVFEDSRRSSKSFLKPN